MIEWGDIQVSPLIFFIISSIVFLSETIARISESAFTVILSGSPSSLQSSFLFCAASGVPQIIDAGGNRDPRRGIDGNGAPVTSVFGRVRTSGVKYVFPP